MRAAVMGMRHGHISEFVGAVEDNPAVTLAGIAEDEPTVRARDRIRAQRAGIRGLWLNCLNKEQPQVVGVVANERHQVSGAHRLPGARHSRHRRQAAAHGDGSNWSRCGRHTARAKSRLGMMLSQRFSAPHRALKAQIDAGDIWRNRAHGRLRPAQAASPTRAIPGS